VIAMAVHVTAQTAAPATIPNLPENFSAFMVVSLWNSTHLQQYVEHIYQDFDGQKQKTDVYFQGDVSTFLVRADLMRQYQIRRSTFDCIAQNTKKGVRDWFAWAEMSVSDGMCYVNRIRGNAWKYSLNDRLSMRLCVTALPGATGSIMPLEILTIDATNPDNIMNNRIVFENFVERRPDAFVFEVPDICFDKELGKGILGGKAASLVDFSEETAVEKFLRIYDSQAK